MLENPSGTDETPNLEIGEPSQPALSSMAAILASVRVAVREEVRNAVAAQVSGETGGQQATTSSLVALPGPSSTGPTVSIGE